MAASPAAPVPLVLAVHQTAHVARIADHILARQRAYVDVSSTGSGKTIAALAVAQRRDLRLIVVCPANVRSVWRDEAARYAVPIAQLLSYGQVRSIRRCQPKHGLLERVSGDLGVLAFRPTARWAELIAAGVLLVLDEFQEVRNFSAQFVALAALTGALLAAAGPSRLALLSASPADKPAQMRNVLALLGHAAVTRLPQDPAAAEEMLAQARLVFAATKTQLFARMPEPQLGFARDVCYLFAWTPPDEQQALEAAVFALEQALAKIKGVDRYIPERLLCDYGELTVAFMAVSRAKVGMFARHMERALESPGKVLAFFAYLDSIGDLAARLGRFAPLVLTGKTPPGDRDALIRAFRDDPTRRVLIANVAVGGVGLSLHDIHGAAPRTLFLCPDFYCLRVHQAIGRIFRVGMRSPARVCIMFGKTCGARERRVLDTLATKGRAMKDFLVGDDLPALPGEFPVVTEPDPR